MMDGECAGVIGLAFSFSGCDEDGLPAIDFLLTWAPLLGGLAPSGLGQLG